MMGNQVDLPAPWTRSLVIMNALVFIILAFRFSKPLTRHDWLLYSFP